MNKLEVFKEIVDVINAWMIKRKSTNGYYHYNDFESLLIFEIKKRFKGIYRREDLRALKGRNLVWKEKDSVLQVAQFTNIWNYQSRDDIIDEINAHLRAVLPVRFTMENHELPRIVHNRKWTRSDTSYRRDPTSRWTTEIVQNQRVVTVKSTDFNYHDLLQHKTSLDRLKQYQFSID